MNCKTTLDPDSFNVTTHYDYNAAGQLISVTDALTHTTVYTYDGLGRQIAVQGPLSEISPTEYAYTPLGARSVVTDARGVVARYSYDQLNRLVTIEYYTPTISNPVSTTQVAYDRLGKQLVMTDSVGITVIEYDDLSRPLTVTDPFTGTVGYQYDKVGNTLVVTNPKGNATRTIYDQLNRAQATVANWQGTITHVPAHSAGADTTQCQFPPSEPDQDLCTLHEYDPLGNTIIITDTLGRMSRNFYDPLGRLEASVQNWNPDTLSEPADCVLSPTNPSDENLCTSYGYNIAGQQVTATNPAGQTTLSVYDHAGRTVVTVANWDDVTTIAGPADCDFSDPDATQNLCSITVYDSLGRRNRATDPAGHHIDFSYDGLGRLATTTRYLPSTPVASSASYDALGNKLDQTDPENNTVLYEYDELNRLETTTSPAGVVITQTYNAVGQVLAVTNGLGKMTVNDYDGAGRLLSMTDPEGNITRYGYDALGQRTIITDAKQIVTRFGHDQLGRLITVTESVTTTSGLDPDSYNVTTLYDYDAAGQLITVTHVPVPNGSAAYYRQQVKSSPVR